MSLALGRSELTQGLYWVRTTKHAGEVALRPQTEGFGPSVGGSGPVSKVKRRGSIKVYTWSVHFFKPGDPQFHSMIWV